MTQLQAYPEYKESGAEWLGRIPAEWDVLRIKMSVQTARIGTWGQDPEEGDFPVWCVRVADFDRKLHSVKASERTMRSITPDELIPRKLNRGDLLLEKSGGGQNNPVGFVVRFDHDDIAVCSNFVAKLQLSPGMDSRFWTYVHATTYSVRLTQRSIKQTSGIQNLDHASYFNELAPFPPLDTQSRIADFLDRETDQIDKLIGKQERLIELLAEKRQAIITDAVTKGLDPTVPAKPSGITGLSEVPAHWTEKPMCHFMTGRVDYRGATPQKTDHGVFLVTAKNVRKGFIDYAASSEYIAQEDYDSVMSRGIPAVGDILMTMEAPLGNVALVDDPNIALAQRVVKFRPKNELIPGFAAYAMNSPYFQSQLEARATGSTALGLKASKLIELRLAAPSGAEQQRITDYLDSATGRIDTLVRRSQAAVKLLMERRSALISAAVTGKIDVTNEGVAA